MRRKTVPPRPAPLYDLWVYDYVRLCRYYLHNSTVDTGVPFQVLFSRNVRLFNTHVARHIRELIRLYLTDNYNDNDNN